MLLALALGVAMVVVRAVGCSAWDLGDGALHYLQVRFAHAHVHLFFDQWAKPLYVLLGSPFAQAGPIGMVVFNAVVAYLTIWGILRIVAPTSMALACLIPVLLFTSVQYAGMILSGMTEPLFGLLTIGCIAMLWAGRFVPAMVLLSLAPWSRPEYVAFAPFVLAWVVFNRKWAALPWLLVGAAVYFGMGWLLIKERIWSFARDPYLGVQFDRGSPWHFVQNAPEVLGIPLLLLAVVCMVGLVRLWFSDRSARREHGAILLMTVLPVLGIWAIHSYAFWDGGHASAGLLRVIATATPLTVLFVAYTTNAYWRGWRGRRMARAATIASGIIALWAAVEVWHRLELPARAIAEQQVVERAATTAKAFTDPQEKWYTAHPYFPVCTGLDMGDTTASHRTWELNINRIRVGDLVEWNPKYGPSGSREMFDGLRQHPGFAVIGMDQESDGPWQPPFSTWLFQRTNERQRWAVNTPVDMQRSTEDAILIWKDGSLDRNDSSVVYRVEAREYPLDILPLVACRHGEVLSEWILNAHFEVPDGVSAPRFIWVFTTIDDDRPTVTLEQQVTAGASEVRFHQGAHLGQKDMRIFLWNIDRQPFVLRDLRLTRRCAMQVANVVPQG